MPSEYVSRQGEAWDQIALARLSGETHISVPEQAAAERVRSLPPWERM